MKYGNGSWFLLLSEGVQIGVVFLLGRLYPLDGLNRNCGSFCLSLIIVLVGLFPLIRAQPASKDLIPKRFAAATVETLAACHEFAQLYAKVEDNEQEGQTNCSQNQRNDKLCLKTGVVITPALVDSPPVLLVYNSRVTAFTGAESIVATVRLVDHQPKERNINLISIGALDKVEVVAIPGVVRHIEHAGRNGNFCLAAEHSLGCK